MWSLHYGQALIGLPNMHTSSLKIEFLDLIKGQDNCGHYLSQLW